MFTGTTIGRRGTEGSTATSAVDGLWIPAIVLRLVAVAVLVAGPWTDEPADLDGWDVSRFQEIAERTEPGWSSFPIEYPPGSVVVFDGLAGSSVVDTGRRLVVLAAAAEALATVLLWRRVGARVGKAFLVLGTPLIPMGLLRLDLVVVAVAVAGAVLLIGRDDHDGNPAPHGWLTLPSPTDLSFGVLVAVGAMIKLWPALLVLGALALGRRTAALVAVCCSAVAGVAWLLVVGDGLEPVRQVLSLRGATGWHVESLPGALVALVTDQAATLQLNAYRIGTLREPVVLAGRVLAVATMAALVAAAGGLSLRQDHRRTGPTSPAGSVEPTERFALVMLGAVCALLVTAPLLSPQFLLWVTPWAALLFDDRSGSATGGPADPRPAHNRLLSLVVAVLVLTGGTLLVFGPPNLAGIIPAVALTVRNLGLLAVTVGCLIALRNGLSDRPS
ncbi:MAG: hypothetical protein AAF531_02100 [Actinomycetota bacterium]